jgi:hypothetical protein
MTTKTVTEADLERAEAKLAALVAKAEQIDPSEPGYDPAILSGIRRKPNPKADRARFNSYARSAAAWDAVTQAENDVRIIKARLATQARNTQIPFTEEQYKAAKAVRTARGWYKVARVNAKSVTVETGYSWTDRITRDKIIEVR